jgi:hypothetical protein
MGPVALRCDSQDHNDIQHALDQRANDSHGTSVSLRASALLTLSPTAQDPVPSFDKEENREEAKHETGSYS